MLEQVIKYFKGLSEDIFTVIIGDFLVIYRVEDSFAAKAEDIQETAKLLSELDLYPEVRDISREQMRIVKQVMSHA